MRYILLLILLVTFAASADIYKWTDESGKVHFGDNPHQDQKVDKVEIKAINSFEQVTFETIGSQDGADSRRVIMYSTEWCGYCKKARAYFKARNISFTERDIEKDYFAKKDYDKLGGKGVPVILVGNTRINGFSVEGFEKVYK